MHGPVAIILAAGQGKRMKSEKAKVLHEVCGQPMIRYVVDAARGAGAKTIVVQARASATGTTETNKYLAQTRSSIVTDQLEADGIPRTMIRQEPIGQTGSSDPTVYNRRVDIILER